MTNTLTTNTAADEAEIRRMMQSWSDAIERKDVDALVVDYAPKALLFDAIPPYKTVGAQKIREVWSNCLPYFPEKFKSEHRDVQIHVNGDTAFACGLHHFIPEDPENPCGMTWMRITVGYRRIDGKWKVVHEHVSIPFNPMDNTAWMIKDPGSLDMPDYSQSNC